MGARLSPNGSTSTLHTAGPNFSSLPLQLTDLGRRLDGKPGESEYMILTLINHWFDSVYILFYLTIFICIPAFSSGLSVAYIILLSSQEPLHKDFYFHKLQQTIN